MSNIPESERDWSFLKNLVNFFITIGSSQCSVECERLLRRLVGGLLPWNRIHVPPIKFKLTLREQTSSWPGTKSQRCYHAGVWCLVAVSRRCRLNSFFVFLVLSLGGNLWSHRQRQVVAVVGLLQHGGYFRRWVCLLSGSQKGKDLCVFYLCFGSMT